MRDHLNICIAPYPKLTLDDVPSKGAWIHNFFKVRVEARSKKLPKVISFIDRNAAFVLNTTKPGAHYPRRASTRFRSAKLVGFGLIDSKMDLDVAEFSEEVMDRLIEHLAAKYSTSTMYNVASHLHSFFDAQVRLGVATRNPVKSRHYPARIASKVHILEPVQAFRYVDEFFRLNTRTGVIYGMAVYTFAQTGISLNELVELKAAAVAENDSNFGPHITITSKTRRERIVPLTEEFAAVLAAYKKVFCQSSKDGLLFHYPDDDKAELVLARLYWVATTIRKGLAEELPPFSGQAARLGLAFHLHGHAVPDKSIQVGLGLFAPNCVNRLLSRNQPLEPVSGAR